MKIVGVVFLVLLCAGGYLGVTKYRAEKQATDGEVHWVAGEPTAEQKARFAKENSGETADGNSERKERTAQQEATTGTQNSATVTERPSPGPEQSYPTPVTTTRFENPAPAPVATGGYPSSGGTASPAPPIADTQLASAPNNLHFGGSGHYEWYRQGDITYRINPATGGSCIAFATLDEWRKQIVYSHGCGRGV